MPEYKPPREAGARRPGTAIMMSECGLSKVYREGKSESLQHKMTFKQVSCGNRVKDNDAITYSLVSNHSKTLSPLHVYLLSLPHVHCSEELQVLRNRRIHKRTYYWLSTIERTAQKNFQAPVSSTTHTGLAPESEDESIYKISVDLFWKHKTPQTVHSPGSVCEIKHFCCCEIQ